ncbi:hypothetical protein V8C34DRAFT_327021 [Trichoderma compactum]
MVELLDQLDEAEEQPLDALLIPSSGGVFLAGSAVVAGNLSPQTLIAGCKGSCSGVDLRLSRQTEVHSDRIDTSVAAMADGLRSNIAPCVYATMGDDGVVHRIYGAEEDAIRRAVQLLLEDMKMVIKRCDAVALAAASFNCDLRRNVSQVRNNYDVSEQAKDGETSA